MAAHTMGCSMDASTQSVPAGTSARTMKNTAHVALALACLAAPGNSQNAVLVVDSANAPGTDFIAIAPAIASAADGDRILVRSGFYPEDLVIVGKGITLQADEPGLVFIQSLSVQNTPPGEAVAIRGFNLRNQVSEPVYAIHVEACQGPVWLDGIVAEAMNVALGAGLVQDCASVSFSRCVFAAPTVQLPGTPPGFVLNRSATYLFDSTLSGPRSVCDEDSVGVWVQGGSVGVYGSTLLGGVGGGFCSLSGPALHLGSGDPLVEIQDSVFTRPSGGNPITVQSGSLVNLSSRGRSHGASSPVYDDESIDLTFAGEPNDRVWVYFSSTPQLGQFGPGYDVPFLLAAPQMRAVAGAIPASGSKSFSVPIGDLGSGTLSRVLYAQALFFEAGASPAFVLSEPSVIHLLDASLHDPEYVLPHAASWTGSDPTASDFGTTVAGAGDVNGDGYGDAIVGAPQSLGPSGEAGLVHAYHGGAGGLGTQPAWVRYADHGFSFGPAFGTVVSGAGDVNGDGYDDVLVSDPNAAALDGRVYVHHGSPEGLLQDAAWSFDGDSLGHVGSSAASAGDLNGDGFDDIVLGTTNFLLGELNGTVEVFYGSSNGLPATPSQSLPSPTTFVQGYTFGASFGSAGDVNADGYDDLVVVSPDLDHILAHGPVYVFLGSASGISSTHDWEQGFARTAACADVDGDGFDDLVLGLPRLLGNGYQARSESGCLQVFRGTASGLGATPETTLCSGIQGMELGAMVSAAGDVNGDGYGDVIASAPGFSYPERDEGAALLYLGSATGLGAAPVWRYESNITASGSARGLNAVAGLGDANADGRSDVLLGIPQSANPPGGCAHAFYGIQ